MSTDTSPTADSTTSTQLEATVPGTSAAPSTTIDQASTIATITTNWQTFFANTSSVEDRIALLEDGESLRDAVTQRAQDPLMGQATAVVISVELTAPDQATVTYNVLLNGNVALPNAQGTAVLQDGVWKVGSASFCALISLGATAPIPGC
ncbi:MAG: hypothetical protein JWL72_3720 [Ilumatobacteraceae bacterium]|nr:hypothetical protein [Ilumatobacteraceae bacterium]MCU1390382.1 hypothetical protein [Ilumatobacteraceae bacterium]